MLQKSNELIYAILAIVLITLAYLLAQYIYGGVPAASSLVGHGLGVVGFVLMLMTETLYSMRKRSNRARWGSMSRWLELHIFTGLVGPFMVLLHPGWRFQGLAGILSLLTLLIVISGVVGRYIYTAVPRTAEGIDIDLAELEQQARKLDVELAEIMHSDRYGAIKSPPAVTGTLRARPLAELEAFLSGLGIRFRLSGVLREQELRLIRIRKQRDFLLRAIRDRKTARRLLALWHMVHVPLGLTLFLVAFVHIGATIYYSMLLR